MATYEFQVTLRGRGDTQEDAWRDAVDAFSADPGEPDKAEKIDEEEEEQ